jgi:hypothetical protein
MIGSLEEGLLGDKVAIRRNWEYVVEVLRLSQSELRRSCGVASRFSATQSGDKESI